MTTATITDPKNFFAGRKVVVLSRQTIGANVWCKVEMVTCPGLKTDVREGALSNIQEAA